ncbi:MAG TPA: FxsA family protein [Micromonosporaceae bacterium]
MRWRLSIAAVLLIPVMEIAVLVAVGQVIGIGWALLATLAGSALGGVVIQREGRRSVHRLREMLETGEAPRAESGNSALRIVAGVALLVPGLVTDLAGLLLLLPPVQALVRLWLLRGLERRMSSDTANQVFGPRRVRVRRDRPAATDTGEVIEGEVVEGEVVDTSTPDERATG